MEGITEGMSHEPFIIASYAIAFILLTWCALTPLMRKKTALRNIRRLIKIEERNRDTDS